MDLLRRYEEKSTVLYRCSPLPPSNPQKIIAIFVVHLSFANDVAVFAGFCTTLQKVTFSLVSTDRPISRTLSNFNISHRRYIEPSLYERTSERREKKSGWKLWRPIYMEKTRADSRKFGMRKLIFFLKNLRLDGHVASLEVPMTFLRNLNRLFSPRCCRCTVHVFVVYTALY